MNRTIEQLKEHYEIEKELANILRESTREERKYLYSSLYDEMFRRVHLHPQLTAKKEDIDNNKQVVSQMSFLN